MMSLIVCVFGRNDLKTQQHSHLIHILFTQKESLKEGRRMKNQERMDDVLFKRVVIPFSSHLDSQALLRIMIVSPTDLDSHFSSQSSQERE
jgi:hypothetical protein